jgi:predicted AAA+ superfamily ATPase
MLQINNNRLPMSQKFDIIKSISKDIEMGKMKELILSVCEDYQNGMSIQKIANAYGISTDEVRNIIETYGDIYLG